MASANDDYKQVLSPGTLKRLHNELKDIHKNKLSYAQVVQDEENVLLFYFLIKGEDGGQYEGGYYIGKLLLPPTYPNKPVDYVMLTPSGRFEINKKICVTNSGYHSNMWTPCWTIKQMLIGFYSIFIDDAEGGIAHIRESAEQRRIKAKESFDYNAKYHCNVFTKFDQFITPGLLKVSGLQQDMSAKSESCAVQDESNKEDPNKNESNKEDPGKSESNKSESNKDESNKDESNKEDPKPAKMSFKDRLKKKI
jgi:ubiquitin-protein ligase